MDPSYPVTCHSVSGYSGGGKKRVAEYRGTDSEALRSPRHYALDLSHKHLPEIQRVCGLDHPPHFMPILGAHYAGIVVAVSMHSRLLSGSPTSTQIQELLARFYRDERYVRVLPANAEAPLVNGALSATDCNGTNYVDLLTYGTDDLIAVLARFDNLGKGASGAAVQCMNIMVGHDESEGTDISDGAGGD